MKQRRGSYRIAYPVEAQYALAPDGLTMASIGPRYGQNLPWEAGMVSDISTGGARIHGKIQLPAGAMMLLRVQFPSDFLDEMKSKRDQREESAFGPRVRIVETKPTTFPKLTLLGKVVNVSLNTTTKTFVHNIQFEEITHGDSDQINRFINLRQRYELKFRRL